MSKKTAMEVVKELDEVGLLASPVKKEQKYVLEKCEMGLKYALYLKCYFLKYIIITCRGSLENSSNKDILHTVVVNLSPISNSLFNFTVIFNQNSIVGGINFNLIE